MIKLRMVRPQIEGEGGFQDTQSGDRQDAAASDGTGILDHPRDLATGG